jgi:Cu+-exporting ATPase
MAKKQLIIKGMHCTSCALNIEKTLDKIPGVNTATVNYAAEKAFVEFDPKTVSASDIIKKIRRRGYIISRSQL